jgi:hypothetical protein
MRSVVVHLTIWVGAVAILAAADVWETKPFMTWSDKELQQVLTDSPWSKSVQVVLGTLGRGGNGIESDGRGGGGDDEDGGGGGRDRGGVDGFGAPLPQVKLVVTWRSALPIKQALMRGAYGLGGVLIAEDQQELERVEPVYVIRLSGLPMRYSGLLGAMRNETFLRRGGGKTPIAVSEGSAEQTDNEIVVEFYFPRSESIALEDKDIEFVTKLGQFDVKKKFTLKDMVFKGKLEL